MESLLNKNLTFLEKELPQLYKRYLKLESEDENATDVYYLEDSGHHNIYLNGKPVHSKYDPSFEGKILSTITSEEDFDTIFVFGIGMGHHIPELCLRYPEKNKIFYEPNFSVFKEFIARQNIEQLYSKNVMFILKDTRQNMVDCLINLFSTFVIYKITFVGLPTYLAEYLEDWTFITKGYVDFFMRYSVNLKTLIRYNNPWLVNFFKNLRGYPFESCIEDYKGKLAGIPGVIVSSGPSLKRNIHLVKGILDKAVVLSAGSSINALEANGIIPHIMLAVDGSQLMSDEYNAVQNSSILFAHILNVHHDCIEKYKGPKMHFKVSSEINMEYFEKVNSISTTMIGSGGSCANVAMDYLVKLGCNPIILIGQDLCFTGNVTHSEGVWDRKELTPEILRDEGKGLIRKKDIFGNEVYTNRVFSTIHKWFEDYIRVNNINETGLEVINATEGGLPIEGAEHMSLREAIEKYCTDTFNIHEMLMQYHTEGLKKEQNNKKIIKNFLEIMEKQFKKIEKMSDSRIEILKKILERLKDGRTEAADLRKQMNKITEKLEKNEAFNQIVWVQSFEMIYNIKNAYELKAKEKENVVEKLKTLYEGLERQYSEIHVRILVIRGLIEETRKELKSMKEWEDIYGEAIKG